MTPEEMIAGQADQNANHAIIEHQNRCTYEEEMQAYKLFKLLNPTMSVDGTQFSVVYGLDITTGVAGFGNSRHAAIIDFYAAFQRPVKVAGVEG